MDFLIHWPPRASGCHSPMSRPDWSCYTYRQVVLACSDSLGSDRSQCQQPGTYRQVVLVYLQTSGPCILTEKWSLYTYRQVVLACSDSLGSDRSQYQQPGTYRQVVIVYL